VPRRLPELDVDLDPIDLSRREVADYYHGFANRTLWPLLHGLIEQPVFDRGWWRTYGEVNERFAGAGGAEAAVRWVHDYQLMLVPGCLRARGVAGSIGFFLHIPWPAPEIFARLPWRREILDGLLGADVVSFQTEEHRENFIRTCVALLNCEAGADGSIRTAEGRAVRTAAHPISIDAAAEAERARSAGASRRVSGLLKQFAERRLLLGVDRLDYTKGILERLLSYELLLERRPELRASTVLVQVAVPSRGEIPEYRELRTNVERAVGRINGRFTEPGQDVPVYYLHRGVSADRLLAYYRAAAVCLVTPLRDGMNLVAKEFVVAQAAGGDAGALVLSEFTGAAKEFSRDAFICNPFDISGLATTIEQALAADEEDRRARIANMAAQVYDNDVFAWARDELDLLTATEG
jgi:trehalose 6-phosphate synthase